MADYFVRGTTGNDASAGTSGATARQHHSAIAALLIAVGSTISHAETQNGIAQAIFNVAGLTFQNEAGAGGVSPAIIRGVHFPTWTASGTRSYVAAIGAGKNVANVCDRYATRVDANGRHTAFLALLASQAAVDTLTTGANGYYYDAAAGNLYVQLNDGTNPTTLAGDDRVGWVEDLAGCLAATAGGYSVSDLRFELCRPKGSGADYPLRLGGGGNTIRRVWVSDGGVHGIVFLDSADDTLEDFVAHGGGQLDSGIENNNPVAAYNAGGNVSGLRIRRGQIHCYTHLAPSGSPVNAAGTCDAIKVHTDGAGGHVVADVEVEDVWSYHYGQSGWLLNISDSGPAPAAADLLTPAAYPARVTRGGSRGCRGLNLTQNASYRNTFFDFTAVASTGDLYVVWIQAGYKLLFTGCTFIFDQGSQAGRFMFRLEAGAELAFDECSLNNRSLNATGPHVFFNIVSAASFKVTAHRTIFNNAYKGATVTRLFNGDSGAPLSNYDFQGCVYSGIDVTRYSNDASRDTPAEWIANVDPTGQVLADPGFANLQSTDPLIAGGLAPSSPLLVPTRKLYVPGSVDVGINGRRNDGTIGSWKYGAPAFSSGGTGGAGGGRLAIGI